eukprot:COSAG06_NODE_7613_length_2439_cov_5.166239_3_plen_137_part_00
MARVAEGAQQQVPSRALPAGCQQPLKRQPAARGWPNKGISVAYGLGRVPPERIGFRDTLILAFPEPQRPSPLALSEMIVLSCLALRCAALPRTQAAQGRGRAWVALILYSCNRMRRGSIACCVCVSSRLLWSALVW